MTNGSDSSRKHRTGLSVGVEIFPATLPAEVAAVAFNNKALVYDLLFKAASETMLTIAADPKHLGARIGITAAVSYTHLTLPTNREV